MRLENLHRKLQINRVKSTLPAVGERRFVIGA
jgi:hypothetical protein